MKIAHLINSMHTGGAENLIAESVPVFKNQGALVDVILLNGIETPFLAKLQTTNCTIVSLSKNSVYNPFLIFKILPLLKKYDVVHVHLFPALYWVAIAKLISFSKVKLVFTEHNTTNKRLSNKFYLQFDNFIYRFYNKVIAISTTIESIINRKIPNTKGKTSVITNGINLQAVRTHPILQVKDIYHIATISTKFITQIAGFRLQKDQKTVIKAMTFLPIDMVLLLVGDGAERQSCELLAKELNVDERVVFLGNRSDVGSILQLSSVIVLSSHYEGVSLSSIEGMASGKPFIASAVPGLKEVVQGAGLLFPAGDAKALAEQIIKLHNNADFYNQTVQNCLKRAAEFDIETMVQKQIELYKKVLL